jgi:hypothetical protein
MNTLSIRTFLSCSAVLVAGVGVAGSYALAAPVAAASPSPTIEIDGKDRLIFKDGRIIEGELLEETDTEVRFLVVVGTISAPQTYSKSEILGIERGTGDAAAAAGVTSDEPTRPGDPMEEGDDAAPGVYVVELEGYYGRDVSATPLRQVMKDAAKQKPQYVVLVVDNLWENLSGQEFDDTVQAFDQLFLTEDIEPIFTKELPDIMGYEPEVIVWVKNAMGGAAFLPFNFENIYFASDGRMGGIGALEAMFGTTGDERVREKQFSLRLGHARGMANRGGYDGRIVEAMARTDFVLSYRIENGKTVLFEGEPRIELGEVLLTDDGAGDNADNIQDRARGKGNDNLTLTADIARDLGVSKGTVDDFDDLLFELELERRHRLIEGRSEKILAQWGRSVENAERELRDLWEQFARIQVGGERRDRITARATQMRTIQRIIGVLKKYEEVISVGFFQLPPGLPPVPNLEVLHEQIKQEQMKDRP